MEREREKEGVGGSGVTKIMSERALTNESHEEGDNAIFFLIIIAVIHSL